MSSAMLHSTQSPVLVTGADGYLGGAILRECAARNIPTLRLGRRAGADVTVDLTDAGATDAALRSIEIGSVIHTAASVPTTLTAYDDKAGADASVAMARNVASAACGLGVPMFLVSSMTVYPADAANPVSETAFDEHTNSPATSAYALGKRDAERAVQGTGVTGGAVRIPGLYGGARTGGLVAGIKAALQAGQTPRTPEAPLQWAAMHVDDAARGITNLLGNMTSGFQPVNVGYAGPVSINRLVEIAAQALGAEQAVEIAHPEFEFDLSRWNGLTGQSPRSFEQAITEYMT